MVPVLKHHQMFHMLKVPPCWSYLKWSPCLRHHWSYLLSSTHNNLLQVLQRTAFGPASPKAGPVHAEVLTAGFTENSIWSRISYGRPCLYRGSHCRFYREQHSVPHLLRPVLFIQRFSLQCLQRTAFGPESSKAGPVHTETLTAGFTENSIRSRIF